MSNYLSARRVRFQEIDEQGNDVGKPTFGILASDNEEQSYTDVYNTREELEKAVAEAGNLLDVVGGFDGISRENLGPGNLFLPVATYINIIEADDGEVD